MSTKKSLKPNTTQETPKTEEVKREFTLKEFFVLWKHESKKNGNTYYTGKITSDDYEFSSLVAFQNSKKKNPKEPDLRIYLVDEKGNKDNDVFVSLWMNATDNGKQYFSGKFNDQRIVGFISKNTENNRPAIRVYFSDDNAEK